MITRKRCSSCKKVKGISHFYKPTEGRCKECRKAEAGNYYHNGGGKSVIQAWRKAHPKEYSAQIERANISRQVKRSIDPDYKEKLLLQKRENSKKNFITGMLGRAKQRAQKYNIPFTLVTEDISVPEYCPILRVKLVLGSKGNYQFSPSIDRVDPRKGYIPENIRVVSSLANTMKNGATREQLTNFAKNILDYIDFKI